MKLRKDRIFIALSIVFLCSLICIYTYRLIHYYNIEHNKNNENVTKENYLYKKIVDSQNIINTTNGLFEVEGEYVFRGNVEDNYVLYDNILYRIIKIDKSNNIKLISNDVLTSLVWGYESDYEASYIKSWLNSFSDSNNINEYHLVNSKTCIDKINSIDKITCTNEYEEDNVSLLSMSEYTDAGGANSYLNIKKYFWLINANNENNAWYVTETGGLSNTVNVNDTYKLYGVRPVITINGKLDSINGNGTKENPYTILKSIPSKLSEASIGSYIKFSDNIYKVVNRSNEGIKVAMNNYLLNEDDGYLYKIYSKTSANYDLKDKDGLAYYLNNTFYYSLKNKDYIISSKWNIGEYSIENKYDYKFKNTVSAKIGLLNIGDLFLNDLDNTFTMTKTNDISDTIYISFNNGISTSNLINVELKVRPAFNLNPELTITSGEGTIDKPYELGK